MSAQPEALRLADLLESCPLAVGDAQQAVAAAELRRLHASCEDYAQHKQRQDQRVLELNAQRDALLEALKKMRIKYGEYACRVCDQADAAIKAVEETK